MNDSLELSSFEMFCGDSPFWNTSLTIDGSYPAFTLCFKEVALAWIPTSLFILSSIPYTVYLHHRPTLTSRRSFLAIAKLLSSLSLLVISIATVICKGRKGNQDTTPQALYVSEALKAVSFIITCFLIILEKRKAVTSSVVLWIFWLVMLVAGIVPFYSNLIENVRRTDETSFILFNMNFAFLTISFVLSSFADLSWTTNWELTSNKTTAELQASMPSLLTFGWIARVIIKGFKKSLTNEDVFELNPADTCAKTVPKFDNIWTKRRRKLSSTQGDNRKSRLQGLSYEIVNEDTPLLAHAHSAQDRIKCESTTKNGCSRSSSSHPISLLRVLLSTFGFSLLLCQTVTILADVLRLFTPMITEALVEYIMNKEKYYEWHGYVLAMSFLVVNTISSFGVNHSLFWSRRFGMRIKICLLNAVYKKLFQGKMFIDYGRDYFYVDQALTRSACDDNTTTGEQLNLMSTDCETVEGLFQFVYLIFSVPIQLGISLYLLYDYLGVATFAGFGVMIMVMPFNFLVGLTYSRYTNIRMKHKDSRMKTILEILNGIKVLKLYAWEEPFENKIADIREKEIDCLWKIHVADSFVGIIMASFTNLVQLTTYLVYIRVSDEGYLSPIVASVSMGLFNLLNRPLNTMPLAMPFVFQAFVSLGRVSKFLNKPDIDFDAVEKGNDNEFAVEIEKGDFQWGRSNESPTLKDIDFKVKQGQLIAVVGTVGCGKSSLLSAILGEIIKTKGRVKVNGSIAYVSQEAWIQNKTLKNNILFVSEYEKRRYNEIINACALRPDLDILPGGDETEIGEKGINISGGQKQRVSLARAVYSDKDIYLLDDPLSAVDSHVGKHIFQEVVSGEGVLSGKTRILVTHGIHWLPLVDSIVVLEGGKIIETGTYEELLSKDGFFSQLLRDHLLEDPSSEDEDSEVETMKQNVLQRVESITESIFSGNSSADEKASASRSKATRKRRLSSNRERSKSGTDTAETMSRQNSHLTTSYENSHGIKPGTDNVGGKLIEDETQEEGRVKFQIYLYYLQSFGLRACGLAMLGLFLYTGNSIFIPIWLGKWTDDKLLNNVSRSDESEYGDKTNLYLGIFGGAVVAQGLFNIFFSLNLFVGAVRTCRLTHKNFLGNILRSPMSFFDTTPMGRIGNRFSRDVEFVDKKLPGMFFQLFPTLCTAISIIAVISYGTPIFLIAFIPVAIIYAGLQLVYIPTSRQLCRLESVSRSPIYVYFTETLAGSETIRAYRAQSHFISEFEKRVDAHIKLHFPGLVASSWMSFYLPLLGNLIVFATALFAVTSSGIEPGLAGVSIAYASQLTGNLQNLVQVITHMENSIVGVERIREYTLTPREADWINPNHRPRKSWPEEGNLVFDNYQTRYRPGLDLVLNNVSCDIRGGEKIGIVGRTGAGKSSITVALFRIIEAAGGRIVIDGEDIAGMGLHDLRNKLTILPQDPVLFSGSIRMNLDPFDQFTDDTLWEALQDSNLKEFVKDLPDGLSYECGEKGSNLSVGQRQLVCLARCHLRKTKILVLDEATAAVDTKTDEIIQEVVRQKFKDMTVLTIAHRLHTVMDYDRVMVLDKGSILEFDTPSRLMNDKNGTFHSMVKAAGISS